MCIPIQLLQSMSPLHVLTVRMCINCSSALWSSLTGVNVEINPCRVRTDDALVFYGFAAREAITQPLNLTIARYLSLHK